MSQNVFQRVNAIKEKVAYVRKDKQVDNYKAVTHDAVTAEVRQWFVEFGVLILPTELGGQMIEAGKTQKGTTTYRFEARYRVDFVNIDEPSDRFGIEITSHALDYGDKAPGKAVSYATKYAILKVLQLETGENDEARTPQNLTPSDLMDSELLAEHLTAISTAKTVEDLQKVYTDAFRASGKDKESQAAIIKAKDTKKKELAK